MAIERFEIRAVASKLLLLDEYLRNFRSIVATADRDWDRVSTDPGFDAYFEQERQRIQLLVEQMRIT